MATKKSKRTKDEGKRTKEEQLAFDINAAKLDRSRHHFLHSPKGVMKGPGKMKDVPVIVK